MSDNEQPVPATGPELQLHHVTETYTLRHDEVDYTVTVERFQDGPKLSITAGHGGSPRMSPDLLELLHKIAVTPGDWNNTTFPAEGTPQQPTPWDRANAAGRSPGFAPPRVVHLRPGFNPGAGNP